MTMSLNMIGKSRKESGKPYMQFEIFRKMKLNRSGAEPGFFARERTIRKPSGSDKHKTNTNR